MGPIEVLCGIAAVFVLVYYYCTSTFNFWTDRGVPGPKPVPLFGNGAQVLMGKMFIGELMRKVYEEFPNEPLVGMYMRKSPILLVRDRDLMKDILIKDFSKFADRGMPVLEKAEPLTVHLFHLEAKRWRPLRTRLSPVFTSGRLKEMFGMIVTCGEHLERFIDEIIQQNDIVECRELTAKFTTDVIGTCVFGLEMNSMAKEEGQFRTMGRKIFQMDFTRRMRFWFRAAVPKLYNLLGPYLPESEISAFFRKSIMETIRYRKENQIVRHDFIDMLIELKEHPEKMPDLEFTDDMMAAQAFVFFAAGFETSSTAMSGALYELAQHQDIQDKLREEIRTTYAKCNGDLQYDTVKGMTYLDQVFRETLRILPPATFLMRKSLSEYTIRGTNVTIPKGQTVWLPTYAIQKDPSIFSNPDEFKPERWGDDNDKQRHPMDFIPFGDGPRNCIGARFAVFQTKIGLIKILQNHKVEVCEKTEIPLTINPAGFILSPKNGIYLRISKIS